ncbi:hypothetical protein PFISCL1PPCAC_12786, partial [Pristionchus fissidentatus]
RIRASLKNSSKKLTSAQRVEFSKIFTNENTKRETLQKEIKEFLRKSLTEEAFAQLKKEIAAHREQAGNRMAEAVKALPEAHERLYAILKDASLDSKQIGERVKALLKSLPKDVTLALFKLRSLFAHLPAKKPSQQTDEPVKV